MPAHAHFRNFESLLRSRPFLHENKKFSFLGITVVQLKLQVPLMKISEELKSSTLNYKHKIKV